MGMTPGFNSRGNRNPVWPNDFDLQLGCCIYDAFPIFQLYHGENKLIFNEMMMCFSKIYQCYVPSINLLALLVHKKKIFKY
jgi:hypothetical protein